MRTFADSMSTYGGNNLYSQGHPALVFGPENAQHVAAGGWKKLDVQKAIFEMARKPWGMVKNRGKSKGPVLSGLGRSDRRQCDGARSSTSRAT